MDVKIVPYEEAMKETALSLRVKDEQDGFVAENEESLSERDEAMRRGMDVPAFIIECGSVPCGFAMLLHGDGENINPVKDCPWYIWRFIVDERFQRMGIGRKALHLLLIWMKERTREKDFSCSLSYEPENVAAGKLYSSLGFHETGDVDEGELVALISNDEMNELEKRWSRK